MSTRKKAAPRKSSGMDEGCPAKTDACTLQSATQSPSKASRPVSAVSLILTFATALAIFMVYLSTAAPGAWWGDGLELACAAKTLGIAHPTGYPLYTLLGHGVIAALDALGSISPGRALTLFSAALLAVAFGVLAQYFRRILFEAPLAESRPASCECGMIPLAPALGIAMLIAFSRTVWDHATFAEVYPLTFLIQALVVMTAWIPKGKKPSLARTATLGLLMGVGALNHYSILACAPLMAVCLWQWGRASRRPALTWAVGIGCAAVLLLGYLYLPLRALSNPPLNWGDPSSPQRLLWTLTGGQFRTLTVDATTGLALPGLLGWLRWWGGQWIGQPGQTPTLSLLLGAGIVLYSLPGLLALLRYRLEAALGLIGMIAMTAVFAAVYHIPDIAAYFMGAMPAAATGWILTTGLLLNRLRRSYPEALRGRPARLLPVIFALALLLTHYTSMDKSWDNGPEVYGEILTGILPEDAIVITASDNEIYTLWYQQMALGRRPDLTVFGSNFITQGWYQRYFESAGRPQIETRIIDRAIYKSKLPHDVQLIDGTILPNLKAGRRIFITYRDTLIEQYLHPRPIAFPPAYERLRQATAYPYHLPYPVVYELTLNPALAEMSAQELEEEFHRFYRSRQQR